LSKRPSIEQIRYQCKSIEAVLYQRLKHWTPKCAFMRRVHLSQRELDDLIESERRRIIQCTVLDYLQLMYPDGPEYVIDYSHGDY